MEEGVCYFLQEIPLENPPDDLNFMDSCVPAAMNLERLAIFMLCASLLRVGFGFIW